MKLLMSVMCSALALCACNNDDSAATGEPSDELEQASRAGARFQRQLDQLADSDGVYGVLAQVTRDGRSSRARAGIADIEDRGPVAWDSRFRAASATKPFVATVVLQLVGEGKLSLDDTVERWLPGAIGRNGHDGARMTIRQLLQHTSGLPDYVEDIFAEIGQATSIEELQALLVKRWTLAQVLDLTLAHPPVTCDEPGPCFSYSNAGYIVLGMIIQAATGNAWDDEVTHRIIEPLGLRQTASPGVSPFIPGTHPHAYEPLFDIELDVSEVSPTSIDASGQLISTPRDLDVFLRALVQGKLLRPAELAEMQRTIPADALFPGARYGLGLAQRQLACGVGYWTHAGDGFGFHIRNGVTDAGASIALAITASSAADIEAYADPAFETALCPR